MTNNNLVFSSFLSLKPNDFLVLEEVIEDFKETLQILLELVKKYGERKNYKEIEKIIETAIFSFDAGYGSDESIEKAHEIGINALIKPKKIAMENNEEFKAKRGIKKKRKTTKKKNSQKKTINESIMAYYVQVGKKSN